MTRRAREADDVMGKAYWINTFRAVTDVQRLEAYAELAGPVMRGFGGRFLARGKPARAFEAGVIERTVLIEFASVERAVAAYESPEYRRAREVLGDAAVRDIRIIEAGRGVGETVPGEPAQIVTRLVEEVMNRGRLELVEELCAPPLATAAKRWIAPFRASFPDVEMEIVDLVAEGEKVVARLTCSGTHLGEWRGAPPTGRRFAGVDEVYFFRVLGRKIVELWGLEDTAGRLRQLGLAGQPTGD